MRILKVVKKTVKKKDENNEASKNIIALHKKALSMSNVIANFSNGFCGYSFEVSEFNDKSPVEVYLNMPSSSDDGSNDNYSVSTAIKVTENRLKTLREVEKKLKTLRDEAVKLGIKRW